jgi:hypothetical protein
MSHLLLSLIPIESTMHINNLYFATLVNVTTKPPESMRASFVHILRSMMYLLVTLFDLCVSEFHIRRSASMVPYCFKKHSRLKYKKWPLGMDVAWQRCFSLCSSWQAVGGCASSFFSPFAPSLPPYLPLRSLGGTGMAVSEKAWQSEDFWISLMELWMTPRVGVRGIMPKFLSAVCNFVAGAYSRHRVNRRDSTSPYSDSYFQGDSVYFYIS